MNDENSKTFELLTNHEGGRPSGPHFSVNIETDYKTSGGRSDDPTRFMIIVRCGTGCCWFKIQRPLLGTDREATWYVELLLPRNVLFLYIQEKSVTVDPPGGPARTIAYQEAA